MNNINWLVRIKNKQFWISLIPAILVFIKLVCCIFGLDLNLDDLGDKLVAAIEALFVILAILGIVTDPTTAGITDSARALTYTTPNKDK